MEKTLLVIITPREIKDGVPGNALKCAGAFGIARLYGLGEGQVEVFGTHAEIEVDGRKYWYNAPDNWAEFVATFDSSRDNAQPGTYEFVLRED